MNSTIRDPTNGHPAQVEQIARDLLPRISQLMRLVVKHSRGDISRSEGGVLSTLSGGPRRVTELAELEGLAQPTTTVLIKRLEQNGWVSRGHDPDDGRVVMVSLTPAGAEALERFRSQYRAVLRDRLEAMPDEQVTELVRATHALGALVRSMRQGDH
jgi:DNA-binding MarR family transcriptional regulator